jgi:hypothetical protein
MSAWLFLANTSLTTAISDVAIRFNTVWPSRVSSPTQSGLLGHTVHLLAGFKSWIRLTAPFTMVFPYHIDLNFGPSCIRTGLTIVVCPPQIPTMIFPQY